MAKPSRPRHYFVLWARIISDPQRSASGFFYRVDLNIVGIHPS